jgi:hypothetical protein
MGIVGQDKKRAFNGEVHGNECGHLPVTKWHQNNEQ